MPGSAVKEVRLPELHLPEIKREEIVRSLAGVRLREVDLARARRTRIRVPAVNLSSDDIGKLVAGAAAIARYVRPTPRRSRWLALLFERRPSSPMTRIVRPRPSRSRWPLVFGGVIVAALAAWALLSRPAVRKQVDEVARRARQRLDEFRAGREGRLDVDADDSVAFPAAETAPTDADGIPVFEEGGRPG